jgi:hypothetical protein
VLLRGDREATPLQLQAQNPGAGGIGEELRFTHCLEGRCLQRLRPTGRKDAQPPIDDNHAKELQAAPLQIPLFQPDFLAVPAGYAVAATTEPSSNQPPGRHVHPRGPRIQPERASARPASHV